MTQAHKMQIKSAIVKLLWQNISRNHVTLCKKCTRYPSEDCNVLSFKGMLPIKYMYLVMGVRGGG